MGLASFLREIREESSFALSATGRFSEEGATCRPGGVLTRN